MGFTSRLGPLTLMLFKGPVGYVGVVDETIF